jgi:hypothetical protein
MKYLAAQQLGRTGHATEDQMCIAVTTTWINTGVTPEDIRRVFYRQPCLVCILAKRNKDSKLIWARRPAPPLPPAQPPPLTSPSPTTLSYPGRWYSFINLRSEYDFDLSPSE